MTSAAKKAASEKILSQGYVADADVALSRLADTFDKSARRWEMVVYPTMFAFILLAGYGFYLIYHLTHDIAVLSHSVTRMATIVSDATPRVPQDMRDMSQDMRVMSGEIRTMSYQMETLKPMSNNIANMTVTGSPSSSRTNPVSDPVGTSSMSRTRGSDMGSNNVGSRSHSACSPRPSPGTTADTSGGA